MYVCMYVCLSVCMYAVCCMYVGYVHIMAPLRSVLRNGGHKIVGHAVGGHRIGGHRVEPRNTTLCIPYACMHTRIQCYDLYYDFIYECT